MKPTRDDLWRLVDQDGWTKGEFHSIATSLGYVKLDVDVEALWEIQFMPEKEMDPPTPIRPAVLVGPSAEVVHDLIRQVLASLDGEGEA